MFGPVFQQELLLANRRGKRVLFRRLYTGWLLVQFLLLLLVHFIDINTAGAFAARATPFSFHAEPFLRWFLIQQFLLVVLVTPAFTAGAITDEKTRGTLQYLLTAGLTSWEILLGKLFGRAAHVASLALAALPLLCFLGVFVGAGPGLLLLFFVALAMPLFAAGAAGLLASVWCRSTRDAVLTVYIAGAAGVLSLSLVGGLPWFDPFAAFVDAGSEGPHVGELDALLRSAGLWAAVGLACLGLAAWRLRPAYFRQLAASRPTRAARWWRAVRPPVGDHPLAWKERWIDGLAPLAALRRIPRWLGMVVVFVLTFAGFAAALWDTRIPRVTLAELLHCVAALDLAGLHARFSDAGAAVAGVNVVMIFLATLLVGARASGAVSGERERQSWEGLLLTPLTVRELLRGKLWGIIGATYPYLGAYALAALPLSLAGSYWALAVTGGALVGAWLAMWVLGSAGLWCSVKARSSWRSLVSTLFFGYFAAFLCQSMFMAFVGVIFLLIFVVLQLLDWRYGTSFAGSFLGQREVFMVMAYLALAGVFLVLPWWFLNNAQKHIAYRERVRRWPTKRRRGPSHADVLPVITTSNNDPKTPSSSGRRPAGSSTLPGRDPHPRSEDTQPGPSAS